jgi:predicted naringenin-chalcone synthase
MSAFSAATYIFTAPTCRTTIIALEPCALNAEFQHFILRDLIKFPYFADTIERGDRG